MDFVPGSSIHTVFSNEDWEQESCEYYSSLQKVETQKVRGEAEIRGSQSLAAAKLQKLLNKQRLSKSEKCDVTILSNNTEIKAHWCVLELCPYFQVLYHSGLKEKETGIIDMSMFSPNLIQSVVEYIYVGTVEVSYDNLKELMQIADYIQLQDLCDICKQYLVTLVLTPDICVNIFLLASLYQCSSVISDADHFIRGHLPELMKNDSLLPLSFESLCSFLLDANIEDISADSVFAFFLKWIEHDSERNEKYFLSFFHGFPLCSLSERFAKEQLESHPLIQKFSLFKELHNARQKSKQGGDFKNVIITFGGARGQQNCMNEFVPVGAVYAYVIEDDNWRLVEHIPSEMGSSIKIQLATDSQNIYLLSDSTLSITIFNPLMKSWKESEFKWPNFFQLVCVKGIVVCFGVIYLVVYAYPISSSFQNPGLYIVQVNQDQTTTVMSYLFKCDSTVIVEVHLHREQYICVLVGRVLPTYHRFYIYDIQLRKLKKHSGSTCHLSSFIHDNTLVVTEAGISKAKIFSFETHTWTSSSDFALPKLPDGIQRCNASYVHHNGHLYIFGGKTLMTNDYLHTGYRCDLVEKEWRAMHQLPCGLLYTATCALVLPLDAMGHCSDCPHCFYTEHGEDAKYSQLKKIAYKPKFMKPVKTESCFVNS